MQYSWDTCINVTVETCSGVLQNTSPFVSIKIFDVIMCVHVVIVHCVYVVVMKGCVTVT